MALTDLAELEQPEIEAALAGLGVPRFHGRQIFHWIYGRGVTDFAKMTDLSQPLRKTLADAFTITTPAIESRQVSEDGTTKFLLRLADGRHIEAVYIPDTPAQTFCISTQVGCAMGCAFCLTGKMGLVRNLTAGEIAGQVRLLAHETGLAAATFNIVFMGMGEPLHNYAATMKAIRIVADAHGLGLPPRRITLSTVQMPPGVPVATVAIGKPGATNAGVLAAQMIALGDPAIAAKLEAYKGKLAEKVEAAARRLAEKAPSA